ncbi:M20/M25/M40 family metallo-hydrolase [Sciscionella marina]|uniref:M20/M25/M40 family metallo-hydrolase n=1 Tax=Sciscionella marina TaxID=508770 RepID=UPI000364869E|nr:M20/M25/M40 family metallo-hydrolase [Sciscionella marina]
MADRTLEHAANLIRFDTTNHGGGDAKGEREAAEYVAGVLTEAGYAPRILESAPRRSNVLLRIPGSDPTLSAVLAHAHLDVVPAAACDWSVDPFSGEVRDGFLWGRGATDMKDMCAMLLSTAERWAREGTGPRRDVVFAFVADEEDAGAYGAHWLTANHAEEFAGCACAISESGGYTFPVTAPDGREVRLYPIATAERGTMHLELTARGRAGHGSRPNTDNAVTALVNAVARIAAHSWPVVLTPAVRGYLEGAAGALGVRIDLTDEQGVLAAIEALGAAASPVLPTIRNSTTPTVLDAGYKVNVIPSEARARLDTRSLPGTEPELFATIDELLGTGVERASLVRNPAVSAPIDSEWFAAMSEALRAEDPEAVPVPFCMGGGTDAKAFSAIGLDCYGFSPLRLPAEYPYREMPHGVDERVPVSALEFGARALWRFLSH